MTVEGYQPFVSVVIPVLNDPASLKRCLAALADQSYPKDLYEIIVIDNNSTEPVEEVIRVFSGVRIEREARPGLHAARNKGIAAAKGDIYAFTDADCIPYKSWIEEGVKAVFSIENCGIIGGRVELSFNDPKRPTTAELFESIFAFRQEEYIEHYHFAVTANVFTTREVIERVGMLDGSLLSGGDQEWGRRVHAAGYRLVYAPQALVKHPARSTIGALLRKHRRVKGGFYDMRQKKEPYPLKEILIDLKDDWTHAAEFDAALRYEGISSQKKIGLLFILLLVKAARCSEMVRLRLGGRPTW